MAQSYNFLLFLLGTIPIIVCEEEKPFDFNFHQNDYHITYERLELVRFNKQYVREMSMVTFKYNRTQAVTNWTSTFNVDLGNHLILTIERYKFMSNEYRWFPMRFALPFCEAIAVNSGGLGRLLTCGNFTGCPLIKGKTQQACHFFPDEKHFAPYIPNGNYKAEFLAEYFSNEVFVFNAFVTVTRPLV